MNTDLQMRIPSYKSEYLSRSAFKDKKPYVLNEVIIYNLRNYQRPIFYSEKYYKTTRLLCALFVTMTNLNAPIQIQPVVIPFALSPSLVGADHLIDYLTRSGQSLYISATKEIPYIFGEDNSIPALIKSVRYRSNESVWSDILDISVGFSAPNVPIFRNLLTHYGKINLAHIFSNAIADYIGQQN